MIEMIANTLRVITSLNTLYRRSILIILKTGPEVIAYAKDYMHVIFFGSILL